MPIGRRPAPWWGALLVTAACSSAALAEDPGLIVKLRAAPAGKSGPVPAAIEERRAHLNATLADLAPRVSPAFPPAAAALARGAAPAVKNPALLEALAGELALIQICRFADAGATAEARARLARDPDVISVEPIEPIVLERATPVTGHGGGIGPAPRYPTAGAAAVVPGDSLYAEQWALPAIGMPAAWAGGTGTPGLLVAIVDTGLETAHPDLAPNLAVNAVEAGGRPGADDDGNGFVDDVYGWNFIADNADIEDGFGHGSHMAGLIGAASDGRTGTVGVTWEVDLLPVRMFDDAGRGTNLAGAQGIVYAAERGAEVINLSWGTNRLSAVIRDAVAYAAARGAVLVASAGNAGGPVTDNFPAAFDQVIAVGATAPNDGLAGFSNRGVRVDLTAPGVNILSTQRRGHFLLSGTSQAAALVSGVAAHLRYRHPDLAAEEIRSVLRLGAVDLGRSGWDPAFGAGRLDAARALAAPAAPLAVITTPLTLAAAPGPTLVVRAAVLPATGSAGDAEFELDLGAGEDPLAFTPVARGIGGPALDVGPVDLAGRAEGEWTLRLTVRDKSGRTAEDRVLFRVDRSAPALVAHEHVDRLAGRRFEQLIRYAANEPVTARVLVREVGAGGDFAAIASLDGSRDHEARLSDLYPGRHEYAIDLTDYAGFSTRCDAGEGALFARDVIPLIDIPDGDYALAASLDGFELGAVADLDGDDRPELLGEWRRPGAKPARTALAIRGDWPAAPTFAPLFTGAPGLPIAARDVDGDGRTDVLVAGVGLEVIAGFGTDAERVLWSSAAGDRRAGGAFTDIDGDGAVEVMFAGTAGSRLHAVEWNGATFDSLPLGFTRPTRAAGFAVADYDGDGRGELVLGSLAGDLVVLEARPEGIVETVREPFLGGVANAIVATHIGDADGDGRLEFAISAVGALLEREERPAIAVFEAAGDDTFRVVTRFEFRDKNTPYDNALAAGDTDGDGRPELLVAQAAGAYLLAADRDDRFLPVWFAPRAAGGGTRVADLDGDGRAEIFLSERVTESPVTRVFSAAPVGGAPPLAWQAIQEAKANAILWETPAPEVRVSDLAVYRLPANAVPGLESDLGTHRIFTRPGEVTAGESFHDADLPPGAVEYLLAFTADDGTARRRILEGPLAPSPAPGAPALVLLAPEPHPATSEVTVPMALARPGPVRAGVYDVSGRLRRLLFDRQLPAGRLRLVWDGRDDQGHRVARGVYFVRAESPFGAPSVRVVLLGP